MKNTENVLDPVTARQRVEDNFLAICILQILKQIQVLCAFHIPGTESPFMYTSSSLPHEIGAIICFHRKQSHI